MEGAEGGSWLVLIRSQDSLHTLPLLRRALVTANTSSSGMCGTGTVPTRASRPYCCCELCVQAGAAAPRCQVQTKIKFIKSCSVSWCEGTAVPGSTRSKMQGKPKAGLRPDLCLCRAEASQKLPGPRGLWGRGRTPIPAPSTAAAGDEEPGVPGAE